MDDISEESIEDIFEETIENAKELHENYEFSNEVLKEEVENLRDRENLQIYVEGYEPGENTLPLMLLKGLRNWTRSLKSLKDHELSDEQIRIIEGTITTFGPLESFYHERDKLHEVKNRAEEIYENREPDGHGMNHHERTARFSYIIGRDENLWDEELELVMSTALLHDVKRGSELKDDNVESAKKAVEILNDVGFREDKRRLSKEGILKHSEGNSDYWLGKILYDSDKLDFLSPKCVEERIPSFLNVHEGAEEELKKYLVRRGLSIEYNTGIARKLAKVKAYEVENIIPDFFDNKRKAEFIEKNEYSDGATELERRLIGV